MLGRVWSIHLSDRFFLRSGPSDRVPAIIWLIHSLNIQKKNGEFCLKSKHGVSRRSKQEPEPGGLACFKNSQKPRYRDRERKEKTGRQGGPTRRWQSARGADQGIDQPRSFPCYTHVRSIYGTTLHAWLRFAVPGAGLTMSASATWRRGETWPSDESKTTKLWIWTHRMFPQILHQKHQIECLDKCMEY